MAAPFRVAVDGGSRGNPGTAAWAVVVLDGEDRIAEGHAGVLGRATNNVAEYHALLEALSLAVERNATDVEVRADSELVVRQIEGTYRVKHPDLKPLHAEAKKRIATFRSFRIVHVPRKQNAAADKLVNRALDRAAESPAGDEIRIVELNA